ncbi:AraC family transcriptional regulator [Diaminobutyricimonas sp. TR449]|uniref:AraC family transcriptional regulator n=1 Tax=Diaminobutyricimonas sp. TR449 TaxID=2708076 RepID=UPI001421B45E|nr:AraC family transcriptional regulator [Diaminobutyricimonas sp. TR449]
MDPLSHLLTGPRAQRAFALRVVMDPPWGIDVRDEAPLTLIAMVSGTAWLTGADPVLLEAGDVAIVRGPAPYTVADSPDRAAGIIIHPDQRCTTLAGESVQLSMSHGLRTWGNAATGQTTMLIGTYQSDAQIGATVAASLPDVAVIRAGGLDPALLRLLDVEITTDDPGQGGTVDRLLDVVLVHAMRAWANEHPDAASGWLAGSRDPLVANALDLLHESPAADWTIDSLAARLAVSRATLAHRFRAAVGEPPMGYLTRWRMLLASELLAAPSLTTAAIADRVGYGSPFALSTAFKRQFGASPTEYRRGLVDTARGA